MKDQRIHDLLESQLAQPLERQRLIGAYLRGAMDDELLAGFEARLVGDHALLDEVEAESVLREGLREMPRAELEGTAPVRARIDGWPRIGIALAAGLVLGVASRLLPWPVAAPRQPVEAVAVVAVDALRGGATPQLAVGGGVRRLVLTLPAPNLPGPFRFRLVRDADGRELGASAAIAADPDGQLGVAIGPLAPGAGLSLRLEAQSGAGWQQLQRIELRDQAPATKAGPG